MKLNQIIESILSIYDDDPRFPKWIILLLSNIAINLLPFLVDGLIDIIWTMLYIINNIK